MDDNTDEKKEVSAETPEVTPEDTDSTEEVTTGTEATPEEEAKSE